MSADDKIAEPHPLPLTRQWVEDYKRYGTGPKPVEGEQPKHVTIPLDETGCPDLQALVERAGRRHAASIGEEYVEEPLNRPHHVDAPLKRPPHQGGYQHITAEEWDTTGRWRHGKQREGRCHDRRAPASSSAWSRSPPTSEGRSHGCGAAGERRVV